MAIEFWFLLGVALLLTVRSGRTLLVSRFPPLADFAIISTVYYAVPLAIAGFFSLNPRGLVFLHPAAADPGLALASMRYAVLALVALELGRSAGRMLQMPRFVLSFRLTEGTQTRLLIWFFALLSLLVFGISLFGVREFFSGYASEYYTPAATLGNAMIFSTVEALGVAIMLTLLLGERSGKVPLKAFIVLGLLALVLVLAVRAKRLEVVSALMPAAILMMAMRPWLRVPSGRIAIVSVALFVLIVVSAYRVEDVLSVFNLFYYSFTEGIYAGHSLPGIEERLQTSTVAYEYGGRFVTALFAFVPRFLWEGKDALVYQGNMALEGVSPLGATSFLAEVVLQGGMIAVAIVYGLLGFAFQRLMAFEKVWDDGLKYGVLPLRFGVYIVAIVIFIPHFRDGIIPAVKLSIQSLLVFVLIAAFSHQARSARTAALDEAATG